jgi:predicted Na+-dependent transporter
MPAVLWIYGRGFTDESFVLPLRDIATALVLVLVPVAIGMTIRAWNKRGPSAWSKRAASLESVCWSCWS